MWCLEILHLMFPSLLDDPIMARTNKWNYSNFNQAVTQKIQKRKCVYILETESSGVD